MIGTLGDQELVRSPAAHLEAVRRYVMCATHCSSNLEELILWTPKEDKQRVSRAEY